MKKSFPITAAYTNEFRNCPGRLRESGLWASLYRKTPPNGLKLDHRPHSCGLPGHAKGVPGQLRYKNSDVSPPAG